MINTLIAQADGASRLQVAGALAFGMVIGWYIYYINRYRKADVQLSDIVALIGAVGGAAILALFPAKSQLFGAYGLGLGIGFFGYFFFLGIFVASSDKFAIEFFLDGRRKKLDSDEWIPEGVGQTVRAMGENPDEKQPGVGT